MMVDRLGGKVCRTIRQGKPAVGDQAIVGVYFDGKADNGRAVAVEGRRFGKCRAEEVCHKRRIRGHLRHYAPTLLVRIVPCASTLEQASQLRPVAMDVCRTLVSQVFHFGTSLERSTHRLLTEFAGTLEERST